CSALRKDGEIREGARPQAEDAGENRIARLEARDAPSHFHHQPRHIAAKRFGKRRPEDGLHLSVAHLDVCLVQAGGVDLNENLIRLWLWPRNVCELDLIGSAIPLEDECSHRPEPANASRRKSFRIPPSIKAPGANLRSRRRRLARPPAV